MSTHACTNNNEEIEFRTECTGAHHEQLDQVLHAMIDGEPCGQIQFSVFEETPSVRWIEVVEHRQREGIGRAMVLELQSIFPETQIEFGYHTDDGAALLESIDSVVIEPSPERSKLESQLQTFQTRAAQCESATDNYYAARPEVRESKTAKLEMSRVIEKWNSARDQIEKIQDALADLPLPQRILTGPEPAFGHRPGM